MWSSATGDAGGILSAVSTAASQRILHRINLVGTESMTELLSRLCEDMSPDLRLCVSQYLCITIL